MIAGALALLKGLPWRWILIAVAVAGLLWAAKRAWDDHAADAYKDGRGDLIAEQNAAEVRRLKAELARRAKAQAAYAQEGVRVERIVERFTKENTVYAATPDGGSVGLPAERVRGIEAARAALFPAAASGGAAAVPADPAADAAGRLDDAGADGEGDQRQ